MKTILIIDDELELLESLACILSQDNWSVQIAQNGMEAIAIIGQIKIDLVLSDIDMPIMNGIDFLKAFRLKDGFTPVVMMSGGIKYTRNQLISLGANDFIEKPPLDILLQIKKNVA